MMICIPVAAATQAQALSSIERAAGLADVLELRMDLISDGNVRELISAVRASSEFVKVLVTNRSGNPADSPDETGRIGVLMDAVSAGADFVDIELEAAPVLRNSLCDLVGEQGGRTRLIVSHHEFRKTPSLRTLIKFFNESVKTSAHVVKIVTFARFPEDNIPVLSLIPYARRRNVEIIAFCMGEQGRISRVMAPLMGSLFTFASLERGAESASGQLTVQEMKQIFRILEGKKRQPPQTPFIKGE